MNQVRDLKKKIGAVPYRVAKLWNSSLGCVRECVSLAWNLGDGPLQCIQGCGGS